MLVDESWLVSRFVNIFVLIMLVAVSNHPLLSAAAIPINIGLNFQNPGFLPYIANTYFKQIVRYYRKKFVQFEPNTSHWLELKKCHENNKFSCLKLIYLFLHVLPSNTSRCGSHASTTSRYGYVQTANEGYLRLFGCFLVFSVPFATALPAFLERGVCLVMKY